MRKRSADLKLIQAFFKLLETKNYAKITVAEIVTEASLSRTTFYRYYTDVYDMYDKISVAIADKIVAELAVVFSSHAISSAELFSIFCRKLDSQKEYIKLLSGENGGKEFFEIVIKRSFSSINKYNTDLSESEFFAIKFVLFSGIATYIKTLMDGTEFHSKYLEMYKKILLDAQEAGERNE